MAKAKRPQTAAEKLGEKLIIGSMVLGAVSLLVVTGSHDKATATEPQQPTTTTVVSSADSIPPLAINAAETPAPAVHQSASKPKTTSAPTAKPKVDDSPIVIVWDFPTCQHPDPAKVDAIEKMQGPFTPAQVKKFVGCPA